MNTQDAISTIALGILTFLYLGQLYLAWIRSHKRIADNTLTDSDRRITLFDCVWYHEDGIHDIWVFLILTIFLPVFLNSLSDFMILINEAGDGGILRASSWLYTVCLASLGVLITLEFSFIHTLWKTTDWIPMLLSALVLDLVGLLVLVFIVEHPQDWKESFPQTPTVVTILLAAIFSLASSLFILLSARISAALDGGKIDLSKIIAQVNSER